MYGVHGLMSFVGGAVRADAMPQVVSGLSGRTMPRPLATPPGRGHPPAVVNVCSGFFHPQAAGLVVAGPANFGVHEIQGARAAALGGPMRPWARARRHCGRLERNTTRNPR